MANDAGGVVRPMGLLYPCQRGNTGQPGMSAFQVNGSPRAYIASSLRERTSTVHPHACREHSAVLGAVRSITGSSPRMWGTPGQQLQPGGPLRFIPTHVGNTSLQTDSHCYPAVHPHACGEHRTEEITQRVEDGSSPRMWGTPSEAGQGRLAQRFIPTHVGNTLRGWPRSASPAVHPHACGEHLECVGKRLRSGGSSPRMWGTLGVYPLRGYRVRFIPTHVGNTLLPLCWLVLSSVHPHACGEH